MKKLLFGNNYFDTDFHFKILDRYLMLLTSSSLSEYSATPTAIMLIPRSRAREAAASRSLLSLDLRKNSFSNKQSSQM